MSAESVPPGPPSDPREARPPDAASGGGFLEAAGSALVWAFLAILVILWTPVVFLVFLLTVPWDRRRRIVGRTFRLLAWTAAHANPFWRVRIDGRLPPRDRAYVVVSNHESLADVMVIGSLPWEMKWLSKAAIGRMPFQGWMMHLAGDVLVRRRDEASRAEAFERLRRWLERGMSVMIFPEGTRAPTPEMLPFRNGAFRLALETGAPVLPLAIAGTRGAIRKGSLVFGRARPRLRILEPVRVDGPGSEDIAALRDRVRERIRAARDELRVELREERRAGPGGTSGHATRAGACLLALLGGLAIAPGATAQQEEEERRGWRGSVELGFTLTEGNSETTNLSAGTTGIHRGARQRWTFSGTFLRATSGGDETANRGSLEGQYDFFPLDRWFVFGRLRLGYNRPAGILRRIAYGAGAGYVLVESARFDVAGEAGATLIAERFENDSTSHAPFGSIGERVEWRLSEHARLAHSATLQPKFEDPGTFLARGELALATRVVGGLGLRVSIASEYDSRPFVDPETGEPRAEHDLTFVTGLAYEF